MAVLTLIYLLFAIWDEDFSGRIPGAVLIGLAVVLLAEFVVRFWDSANRWTYLGGHWIDVVACLPVIGGLRLLRVLRVIRVLAGLRLIHAIDTHLVREKRERASLWFLGPTLFLIWTSAAYAIWVLERGLNPALKTFGDALYWSAITITTIGYGDIAPVTVQGRVVAGLLAFLGIGLFGFLSAQITARLIRQPDATYAELRSLRRELFEIKQLLERRTEAATNEDAGPSGG